MIISFPEPLKKELNVCFLQKVKVLMSWILYCLPSPRKLENQEKLEKTSKLASG